MTRPRCSYDVLNVTSSPLLVPAAFVAEIRKWYPVIALAVLAFLAIIAIGAVVRQTFAVALYRYATTSSAQGPFEQRDLQSPFRPKRGLFR